MKRKFTILTAALLLLTLIHLPGNAVGQTKAEGDELAICQGTGSGYGTRRTLTDSHSVGWVLASGQSGYLGANNATSHGNVKPTAADLPVVKAVKSDATTSTTGYYFYYTTTAVANVGSLEFSYTANSGNSSATAYVVVGDVKSASGGDAYEIITLSSTSTTAQNASLGTSGTFTYTFNETQTSARYYGFIIVTSSYKRLTSGTIKLKEGAPIPTEPYTVTLGDDNSTLTESSAGAGVTLPLRSNVGDYTFAGWNTTNITDETSTAPTIIPVGTYHPTQNITLYPVYSRSGIGTTWTLYSSPSTTNVTEGVYAILTPTTNDNKAFNGTISGGDGGCTSDAFVFTNNVASSAPAGTCEITMVPVMSGENILGYKMYDEENNRYLYAKAASTGNLDWQESENSYWSYSSYDWCYNANGAHLRVNNNSVFRSYAGTTGTQIKVARKGTGTVTYYVSTTAFKVTYNANGGTGTDFVDNNGGSGYANAATVTVLANEGNNNPNFTKAGHTFAGWYRNPEGTGTVYGPGEGQTNTFSISGNTTLYAKWNVVSYNVAIANIDNATVTATYGGSNTINEGNSANLEYNTAVTLNAEVASGYTFSWLIKDGDNNDVTASVLSGTTLTVPAYNVTITGTTVQTHSVTYDCNGGTSGCPTDLTNVAHGTGITLADAPTYAGHLFMGWSDGSTIYETGAEYTVNSNVTFTAQWMEGAIGTINFGNTTGYFNVSASTTTCKDNLNNTWTATVEGTTSYSPSSNYVQVGSGSNPATSITFSTTLPNSVLITSLSAKFEGNSGTAGTITLKVGDTSIGTGSLNGSSVVVVTNSSSAIGTTLTVTITDIAKGIKCYYISYTYASGSAPIINAPNSISLGSLATPGEIAYSIVNPVSGKSLTATTAADWISNINVAADKVTFNATTNTSLTDDRTATITLHYEGAIDKVVTVTQSKVDYADMPLHYNGGKDNLPTGFTQNGLGGDYGDANSQLKFDTQGDYLVLKLKEAPVSLTYNIKGNSFSGGTFKVQTSANGETYEDLDTYTTLAGSNLTVTHIDLNSSVRYIKWVYTTRSSGNVGIGNIHATTEYDIYGTVTATTLAPTASKKCTIYNGGVLTVTGTLTNTTAANLVIEDGGQLITTSFNVAATVKKGITGRNNSGTWNFIASPVSTSLTPSGLITDDLGNTATTETATYDLYYYDEVGHHWRNYRTSTFDMDNGQGYLYGSKTGTTINFAGTLRASNAAYTSSALSYTSGNGKLAGWNLVGNPFACNATVSKDCYIVSGGVIVAASGTVAAPCSGVMVKATGENETVTFTPTTNAAAFSTGNHQLNITIANEMTTRGESPMIDNAIVSFNENSQLEKFYFGNVNANIYIPQGNEEYAITFSEGQGELPVNFRAAENGSYTLTVNPEGVEMNYLHLIDNMTGADIDLLMTPSYSFEARTSDYESRFRLVFASGNVTADADNQANFAFYSNGSWIINNAGEATLQVIDLNGRMLSSERVNGSVSKAINAAPGVYMLRLINGENVMVQKVVVR